MWLEEQGNENGKCGNGEVNVLLGKRRRSWGGGSDLRGGGSGVEEVDGVLKGECGAWRSGYGAREVAVDFRKVGKVEELTGSDREEVSGWSWEGTGGQGGVWEDAGEHENIEMGLGAADEYLRKG